MLKMMAHKNPTRY